MGYLHDFLIGETQDVEPQVLDVKASDLPTIMTCNGEDYVVNTLIIIDATTSVASVHDIRDKYLFILSTDIAFPCRPTKARSMAKDTLICQAVDEDIQVFRLKNGQWRIFSDGQIWVPEDDGAMYEIIQTS